MNPKLEDSATANPNDKHLFIFKVIWIQLTLTVLIFAYLDYAQIQLITRAPESAPLPETFRDVLLIISVFELVMAFILPRIIYRKSLKSVASASTGSLALSADQIKKILPSYLVHLALIESVAIYGFIVGTSVLNVGNFWWFGGPALLFFIYAHPTPENLKRIVGIQ
jgi:hypothetical protein